MVRLLTNKETENRVLEAIPTAPHRPRHAEKKPKALKKVWSTPLFGRLFPKKKKDGEDIADAVATTTTDLFDDDFEKAAVYCDNVVKIYKSDDVEVIALQGLDLHSYDMVVLYNPADVVSLKENFPDFEQGDLKFVSFGRSVVGAMEEAGLKIAVKAPTPAATSVGKAIELYLEGK